MVPDRIEREIVIAAPVERVWEVVTRAEHVGAWFGDAGAEIDLRPGGAMVIRFREYGVYHCVVETVDPPRVFSFRGAREPGTGVRDGNSTLCEFTLTPEDGGTRLRVVESGFGRLEISPEEQRKQYDGNVEGWAIKLPELRDYAERTEA